MGVGRRMKKQGPPEPLSEAHFENLKKRKAGLPVADAQSNSKKRRTSGDEAEISRVNINAKLEEKFQVSKGKKKSTKEKKKEKEKPIAKRNPADLIHEYRDMDDDSDAANPMHEFKDAGEASLGDAFMDSGSDVYDSDQDPS